MVINGAIVSDLDMMYIESVLQVRNTISANIGFSETTSGFKYLLKIRKAFVSEAVISSCTVLFTYEPIVRLEKWFSSFLMMFCLFPP